MQRINLTGLGPCHTSFLTRYFRHHYILLKDDETRQELTLLDNPFLRPNLFGITLHT